MGKQSEKVLEQTHTLDKLIRDTMNRSKSRDISINNIGSNSSMTHVANSSYSFRSNVYNSSTSSYENNLSDGDGETASTTFCKQTLLDRRLGSFPETKTSESSNDFRPRKLKINKGKDRIIPVQYVRRHSSNSNGNVTPSASKDETSSKPITVPKTSTLENVDSLNILQFLPIISSRS